MCLLFIAVVINVELYKKDKVVLLNHLYWKKKNGPADICFLQNGPWALYFAVTNPAMYGIRIGSSSILIHLRRKILARCDSDWIS